MEAPARGDLVTVLFPLAHRGASKARPALVLSGYSLGPKGTDYLVAAVTTQEHDPLSILIEPSDLASGALEHKSYVRPLVLYPASLESIGQHVGKVTPAFVDKVIDAIKGFSRPSLGLSVKERLNLLYI